jgi:hypothetical protein
LKWDFVSPSGPHHINTMSFLISKLYHILEGFYPEAAAFVCPRAFYSVALVLILIDSCNCGVFVDALDFCAYVW